MACQDARCRHPCRSFDRHRSPAAVVPKADIRATNVDTNVTNTAVTDSLGAYSFLSLPVGRYSREVKAEGFQRYEQTDITLNTNDALRFDIVLKVGEVTQSIEVATNAVHVETAKTQLGDVIAGSHTDARNTPMPASSASEASQSCS